MHVIYYVPSLNPVHIISMYFCGIFHSNVENCLHVTLFFSRRQQQPSSPPPLNNSAITKSTLLMGREHHGGTKKIMGDHSKLTRAGSVKPLKLSPRRDFGPAQDFPTRRQYSLKGKASSSSKDHENDANSNDGGGKKQLHLCAGIIRKNNKKVANKNTTEDVLTTVFSTKVS